MGLSGVVMLCGRKQIPPVSLRSRVGMTRLLWMGAGYTFSNDKTLVAYPRIACVIACHQEGLCRHM